MSEYLMEAEEWDEPITVDFKKTAKTVKIVPVDPRPRFTYGAIDKLWDKGGIVIREPKPGGRVKITRDYLADWGDGTYTLYPERAGLPYYLRPKEGENG